MQREEKDGFYSELAGKYTETIQCGYACKTTMLQTFALGKFFKPKRVENALSIVFLCSLLAAPAARGFAPALNCIEAQCSGAALAGFNVGNVDTVMCEGTL